MLCNSSSETERKFLKSKSLKKYLIAIIIFSVICALTSFFAPPASRGLWYSIIPPVLAILLAFVTHNVLLSLGTAIIVGGLLSQAKAYTSNPLAIFTAMKTAATFVTGSVTSIENLWILSFVVLIFIMLKILIVSGGFNGLVRLTAKIVTGKKTAQLVTALLGVCFFIDDYANAIIVGSAMRPITDRFRISREKLAFIVDATSAPVTGLAVISTWIATEVSLFETVANELGINKSGYSMFFDAIRFRFYCVMMLIFMFLHILMNIDFGPMKTAEKNADSSGNFDNQKNNTNSISSDVTGLQRMGKPISAIVPIVGLLIFHITALWIGGGGLEKISTGLSPLSLAYWRQTISDADSTKILAFSSTFGICLAAVFALFVEKIKITAILKAALASLKNSYLPVSILILAWSLKKACDLLGTGDFLVSILADNIPPLFFPALVFFVASITSFATGTSWGTMAILIPTAIPVAFALDGNSYGLTTMISLGAVLDGAIFGDHCSPISDTTILSSISSRCELIQHVRTQLPYSLSIAALAFLCGYLPAALGLKWIWTIFIALTIMFASLAILKKTNSKIPLQIK